MKFHGRFTRGLILLFTVQLSSFAALAQTQLDVRIKPSNAELKANIEGYVGSLGERDDIEALRRFSVGAEEQALKAVQALGYYQAHIGSEVEPGEGKDLRLRSEEHTSELQSQP